MDQIVDLADQYIGLAERCLASARLMLEDGDLRGSVNRSYYCVFNCAQALLAHEGVGYSKHKAVISHFRKNYVHTGIFGARFSKIIGDLFDDRNISNMKGNALWRRKKSKAGTSDRCTKR
ncbi:MAG: HEPN domain-containing protein [Chitinispirillales bacterium]|jgi:uncharacterized protein (UPF0332 family)|nr:HEPN domain-containing protein [Chitinispirillales bacterium]